MKDADFSTKPPQMGLPPLVQTGFHGPQDGQERKTLILRDRRERKSRCTIWPLRNHPALRVIHYPWTPPPDLTNYFLLWPNTTELSPADENKNLLLVDGSWRWAEKLSLPLSGIPKRSLRGIRTAYPRSSKLFEDPEYGLATVEALFAAHFLLGKDIHGLLDHYHWAEEFLTANPILKPIP